MKRNRFPSGWNESRVRRVLEHYERQTEDEAVAEDEASFRSRDQTVMVVPKRLVPTTPELSNGRALASRQTASHRSNKALQPSAHKPRRG